MNDSSVYFQIGLEHILSLDAYDHILYILATIVVFQWYEWKKVTLFITSFTIGHAVALLWVLFNWVSLHEAFVEVAIILSIFFACINNLFFRLYSKKQLVTRFIVTNIFFGLIHGLGFSNYLKNILIEKDFIILPLIVFNIGLEIGQLVIVFLFMVINYIFIDLLQVTRLYIWQLIILFSISLISLYLIFNKLQLI